MAACANAIKGDLAPATIQEPSESSITRSARPQDKSIVNIILLIRRWPNAAFEGPVHGLWTLGPLLLGDDPAPQLTSRRRQIQ
jgi:hypothetical protein